MLAYGRQHLGQSTAVEPHRAAGVAEDSQPCYQIVGNTNGHFGLRLPQPSLCVLIRGHSGRFIYFPKAVQT